MAIDRKTPTTGNYGASISGTDYADAVNEEVEALWARSCVWLDSVAGTNTITASADPTLAAYSRNNQYNLIPANTNSGAATLAIDGLTARSIRTIDGVALTGGELVAGRLLKLQDDGTLLRIMNQPPTNSAAVSAIAVQTFTASGTYTPNALMVFCRIRMVGPGGGGGGGDGGAGSLYSKGAGGGGGEYAEGFFDAAAIGASKAVTIGAVGAGGNTNGTAGGAGGTTSVGSLITAAGGSGGGGSTSTTTFAIGGAGGTGGSGGHLRIQGGQGTKAVMDNDGTNTTMQVQGLGGPSILGSIPTEQTGYTSGADVTGNAGSNYGTGGNGGYDNDSTGSAGGNGGPSIVIIEEYLRAA
jgi:hypothetical protein